ncbi:hypothetical protein Ancab_019638 [Ancistrocladus abbreviatus]
MGLRSARTSSNRGSSRRISRKESWNSACWRGLNSENNKQEAVTDQEKVELHKNLANAKELNQSIPPVWVQQQSISLPKLCSIAFSTFPNVCPRDGDRADGF